MPSKGSALTKDLREFSLTKGADLFGVADLAPVRPIVAAQGPSLVTQFPRAVSIGMRLSDAIVDSHSPLESRRDSLYWHHVYSVVTASLDFHAYQVSRWLADRGFQALPVPGSTPYNFERLEGIFSHKLAAHLAGLGWIGKSCLLLTEPFGPRARFVSVLTDAPLEAGSPLDKPCGKCHACIDACPVKAFTGAEFNPDEGREVRFDVFKCSEYRREHPCGLCSQPIMLRVLPVKVRLRQLTVWPDSYTRRSSGATPRGESSKVKALAGEEQATHRAVA